jgi:hypothetical protein
LTYARSDRETFIAKRVELRTVRDGIAQAGSELWWDRGDRFPFFSGAPRAGSTL